MICRDSKIHYLTGLFFFCWLSLSLFDWPRLGDPLVYQNLKELYESHSPGRILDSAYKTFSKYLAQFPVDHLCRPVCLVLYVFALIGYIRSLYDWSFRVYDFITNIIIIIIIIAH